MNADNFKEKSDSGVLFVLAFVSHQRLSAFICGK
jgi:hypothetical protein